MTQYRFAKEEMTEYQSVDGEGRYARILLDPKTIQGARCSFGVFRYEPGVVGPAHEHETEVEVYFGLRGAGEVEFLGKAHRFEPGVAVYIPPKAVHQTRNVGDGELEFAAFFAPAMDLSFIREWKKVKSDD
ncbi:MAG: cupin domain-containing protein [Deltaproteobacteria bacterium]|nr:cupin domain-containing protein [Deltaproteobacteria bacterium]MBW2307094.1 cupin domain-containing protein [Deltaproteobacteria bacterium]